MKPLALILSLMLGASTWTHGQSNSSIGMLPTEKRSVEVPEDERNPFGRRGSRTPSVVVQETETEESRIRGALFGMQITGFVESTSGNKALLGSLILGEGRLLPPVIERQTERLQVVSVEPEMIEIGFLDKDGNVDGRVISIPVRVRPDVRYILGTQRTAPPRDQGSFGGVIKTANPDAEPE